MDGRAPGPAALPRAGKWATRAGSVSSTGTDQTDDGSRFPAARPSGQGARQQQQQHQKQQQQNRHSAPPGSELRVGRFACIADLAFDDPRNVLNSAARFAQENYECSFCSWEEPTFKGLLDHIALSHPWYDLSIHRNIR
ncbi:hypothetical protein H4R18_003157 [Coemansia javaensis]|uniref:Uncharacterized protein n=1 Tax=Coemansia javaensis TaxID=2761396 RepID=A0A9W8HCV8_9FUNG|nr:hypothetical protein H4R18_003157 [Coemansia javaensis]